MTDKIIYCRWGYSMAIVDFFIVLKDNPRSMEVEKIGSLEVADGFLTGMSYPDTEARTGQVYRVLKRKCVDGADRYLSSFGKGFTTNAFNYYGDGVRYNHCD